MTLRVTREALMDGSLRARQLQLAAAHPDIRWRTDAEMTVLMDNILSEHPEGTDLYVFGYGSLIWNPAFDYIEKRTALLHGWHRRFCLKMMMGRGSREQPGLMLALDHGGACKGVAFRIEAARVREELSVLWQREMFGGGYNARWVRLKSAGETVRAVTFVINRRHPRYTRELSVEESAAMIATACGDLGTCREYLENTIAHLAALGLKDAGLQRIAKALPKAA